MMRSREELRVVLHISHHDRNLVRWVMESIEEVLREVTHVSQFLSRVRREWLRPEGLEAGESRFHEGVRRLHLYFKIKTDSMIRYQCHHMNLVVI